VTLGLKKVYRLWDFDSERENPVLTHYIPEIVRSEWTVVIFPGGGYEFRSAYEGEGYAEFFNKNGINSFVVDYRVLEHFPCQLADARRAIRFLRKNSSSLGVNKNKIAVMGSSAGGHLAALLSTYKELLSCEPYDNLDEEDYLPNAQILCYPVIHLTLPFGHVDSAKNLLQEQYNALAEKLEPDKLVTSQTPPAFIWHTFGDKVVSILNSIAYATALSENNVDAELHIFPNGEHGMGLADKTDNVEWKHIAQWSKLLLKWLEHL
jgi:acetyl esterase/lipase